MPVKIYKDVIQGSDEWAALRRGIQTASETSLIITSTGKVANNDKTRAHVWELASQRISGYVEPGFLGYDMARGHEEEIDARRYYQENYGPVEQVGFITNDDLGFQIGFSPDGLVGEDGIIEAKSRKQKFQIETIVSGEMPDDFKIQVQTGLWVSQRKWCDFISFSNGLPMITIRVEADPEFQALIVEASKVFNAQIDEKVSKFNTVINDPLARIIPTERKDYNMEMSV